MENVWRRLPRPVFALAPMEDVTDTVFRRLIQRWGRPTLVFTEFIHTDIVLDRRRWPGVTPRLQFTADERPIIAQIWGNDPEAYARAAERLRELGFDGIDINMGCPVRKIRRKGACSALIEQPALAAELIDAASTAGLPVSVKTRIGYDTVKTEQWCAHLLSQGIAALSIHGRIALQESEGFADWNEIGQAARVAREMGVETVVLGNGDLVSRADAVEKCARYGLDGVMIGRGIFTDPMIFRTDGRAFPSLDADEKIEMLEEHLHLYEHHWGERRNYEILKKFFKIYLAGFDGCESLRERLNQTHDYASARDLVAEWKREGSTNGVRVSR